MKKNLYFSTLGAILLTMVLAPIIVQAQEIIEGHCENLMIKDSFEAPWPENLTVMGLAFDGENLWAVGRSHDESTDHDRIYKLDETNGELEVIESYEITFIQKGSGTGIAFDISNKKEPQLWLTDDFSKLVRRVEVIAGALTIQESFDPGVNDSSGLEKYGKYFWISECGYPVGPYLLYKIREKKDVMDITIFEAPGYCPVGIAYDDSFIWSVDHKWENNPDGDMVYKLSTNGKIVCSYDFSDVLDNATGITFDDDKYMWVADRGYIYKLEFDE